MLKDILQPKEKKVEYIELIYDLIFVYIIGRNNSLLHVFSGGFVAPSAFLVYVLTSLAVIQIWNFTTYYINIYGRHSIREHVFLFINMFLLYFMGEGTRSDWQSFFAQYHISWSLILVNVCIQYLFELRHHKDGESRRQIKRMVFILFGEAALVLSDIFIFESTRLVLLSPCAVVFGIVGVFMFGQRKSESIVDFPHLSERAMLYVVFTFGEMIIGITAYFEGEFSLRSTYFALMVFLIVVGLFISYGVFYDRIIDREKRTNGLLYMLLHIFIIFALNNITSGLEFMHMEEINIMPKVLFLTGSFVTFFGFLFALGGIYAKKRSPEYIELCLNSTLLGLAFIIMMFILHSEMMINIALTVVFVFTLFGLIYRYGINQETGNW